MLTENTPENMANTPSYHVMFSTPPVLSRRYDFPDFENLQKHVCNMEYVDANNGYLSNFVCNNPGYILEDVVFSNLKKFCENTIQEYLHTIYQTDQKIKITQSWINKNPPGTIHTLHQHPNSFLSGVFYFQVDQSTPIEFISNYSPTLVLESNSYNEFTGTSYTFSATEGTLILFPSYIKHRVGLNKTNSDRISLSFNTFPIEMGSKSGMTYFSTQD